MFTNVNDVTKASNTLWGDGLFGDNLWPVPGLQK